MQAEASLEATAALGDQELADLLEQRKNSGEAPLTWEQVKKDLGL